MKISTLILILLTTLTAFSQTNWTLSNTGIPTGYSPNDFAKATNGDIYLVASQYNGTSFTPKLLKSTNNGSSWSEITMIGLTNVQNTNSIIFSGSKLLLAGSNSTTASYYVYSSTDNGSNWTLSNTGVPTGYSPNDFATAPNGDVYLVCSHYNGTSFSPNLLKSTDNGSSWSEITMTGLTNVQNPNSIIFNGSKLLLSGSGSGNYYVYSSTDNGSNWTSSNSGVPSGYSVNDFANTTGQEIYAACSQWNGTSFAPHIIISTSAGTNWSEITGLTGLTSLQNTNSIVYTGSNLLLDGSNSSTSSYFVFSSILSTTGIEDASDNIFISIFPNPFSTQLTFFLSDNEEATVSFYDFLGQQILQQTFTNSMTVSTEQLADGIYFYELRNDKGIVKNGRVIKQ